MAKTTKKDFSKKDRYEEQSKGNKDKKDKRFPKEGKQKEPKTVGFKSCNDIKWYSQNAELMNTAGSISYGQIAGLTNVLKGTQLTGDTSGTDVLGYKTVAGIMAINYIPGVGVSENIESNINVAARLVYTFIRHANSGSRNYEAPDYMTYLLSVANAQAYYAWMVRTYGLINHTAVMNRYKTKALVKAAGANYENLVSNMAAFHYYINYYANKINSLAVPKDQYIYDRMTFLPLHVFTDGDDPKAQMYLFKPTGFYRWDGTTYETGSALVYRPFGGNMTLDAIIEYGDSLLKALLENEDIGIMSGDTLKAYGAQGIRQVNMMPAEYVTPIIKDDGVLAQIHNSLSLPYGTLSNLDITQDQGVLKYQIRGIANGASAVALDNCYLDTWMQDPKSDFNMEATRLMTFVQYREGDQDNPNFGVYTSGTEVVVNYTIYSLNPDNNELESIDFTSTDLGSLRYQGSVALRSWYLEAITKFDWYPIVYQCNTDENSATRSIWAIGDLQNYTVVDKDVVNRLHNCAIQSLFNVYGLYLKTN